MSDGTPVYFFKPSSASPPVPTRDVLHYIADMLRELESMAKQQRCENLAEMLSVSAAEARRQAEDETS